MMFDLKSCTIFICSWWKRQVWLIYKDESVMYYYNPLHMHAQRFDINYDDFNGWNAVQVKLLRALVSDINNVSSLLKSQIMPDANKRITAVSHNFPWREVLFYGGVRRRTIPAWGTLERDERSPSNRIIYIFWQSTISSEFKNKNEIECLLVLYNFISRYFVTFYFRQCICFFSVTYVQPKNLNIIILLFIILITHILT